MAPITRQSPRPFAASSLDEPPSPLARRLIREGCAPKVAPRPVADVQTLRDLIVCLLDNEPDDVVADGGITVLDVWRSDARRALGIAAPAATADEFDALRAAE